MTKQYLPTATLKTEVATAITQLQDFIAACRDARQARKAQGKSSWFTGITCTKKSKLF